MLLKNYTSDVPAHQTIYRIEQVLIKAGVTGIEKLYGLKQEVTAITFRIQFDAARPPIAIRMPADVDAAQQALWLDYVDGDDVREITGGDWVISWSRRKKRKKSSFREQAERTAWKLVQDWIEVQVSMIQLRQADFVQVFLPYVWDGRQTYYESLKADRFMALMPAGDDAHPV